MQKNIAMKDQQIINEVIPAMLERIEREHEVKILLAVEAGSRAWGFPSQNSDWDVRIIYCHRPEWYFQIGELDDHIEFMDKESDLDVVGWDIKKALTLLHKSNPSLLEWINSTIVYRQDNAFVNAISTAAPRYFNPIGTMYHYERICVKHDKRYVRHHDCNMKHFLYFLRGGLACRWIEQHRSMPAVDFEELVEATVDDHALKQMVAELIALKRQGTEHDMTTVDARLMAFAQRLADYYEQTVGSFRPEWHKAGDTSDLDNIFYSTVMKFKTPLT